jgi:polyisoprenoid-binding protein YceI
MACLAGFAQPETVAYNIRPASGARFALTVEKTGLLSGKKHVFVFDAYQGVLHFDPDAPERSSVELSIQSGSATCIDKWVSEKDLKKIQAYALNDMLAAGRYPELHFSSAGAVRKGAGNFEVEGMLTIRGIARPAKVTVALMENSGAISSLSGRAVVRLKDYGLKPPTAALGTIGTKNEMIVEFLLLPTRQGARVEKGSNQE